MTIEFLPDSVVVWVSPKVDSEKKTWVQVVYLGNVPESGSATAEQRDKEGKEHPSWGR